MRGYIAPTDFDWYAFLRARPEITEVNFWRPGAVSFKALHPGEVFFFKLKRGRDAIAGFGVFSRFTRLPIWQAWDLFGPANGVTSEWELLKRLSRLASPGQLHRPESMIGCLAINEPVFLLPMNGYPPRLTGEGRLSRARDMT